MVVAVVVVVVAGAGAAIGTGKWRIWPDPDDLPAGVEPQPAGPELALAEGMGGSVEWRVTAFKEARGDICMHFETYRWKSGGCGFGISSGDPLTYMTDALEPDASTQLSQAIQFAYGPIAKNVARITVTLNDGRDIEVVPIDAVELPVNAFVARWKGDAQVQSIVAYDEEGTQLDRTTGPP